VRPVQIWVVDVRAAGFAEMAHAQSVAVARSASAVADQGFIEAVGGAMMAVIYVWMGRGR